MARLAAYTKSSEILQHIRTQLKNDPDLQGYMENELQRTGTDVGKLLSGELKQGKRPAKEV